jgi:hypothetical protein
VGHRVRDVPQSTRGARRSDRKGRLRRRPRAAFWAMLFGRDVNADVPQFTHFD